MTLDAGRWSAAYALMMASVCAMLAGVSPGRRVVLNWGVKTRLRDAQVKTAQSSTKATNRRIIILINATEKRSVRDRQMWSRGVGDALKADGSHPKYANSTRTQNKGTLFRCTTTTITKRFISRLLALQNASKCTEIVESLLCQQTPQLFGSLPTCFESLFKPFLFYLQLFLPSVPA